MTRCHNHSLVTQDQLSLGCVSLSGIRWTSDTYYWTTRTYSGSNLIWTWHTSVVTLVQRMPPTNVASVELVTPWPNWPYAESVELMSPMSQSVDLVTAEPLNYWSSVAEIFGSMAAVCYESCATALCALARIAVASDRLSKHGEHTESFTTVGCLLGGSKNI